MSFEIIEEGMYVVPNAGYRLDLTAETHVNEAYDEVYGKYEAEYRRDDDVDSFKDLDGAALCKGEDDNLYAVEYGFIGDEWMPKVWQRVVKA